MRIRKHAKKTPLVYDSSSLLPGTLVQTHICQLNQSPWDLINFSPPSPPPPPPPQVDAAENGSSTAAIPAAPREINIWRSTHEPPPPVKGEEIILCCKTDGKSWQCRREAAKGNSLCDHHLSLMKSYSTNSSPHPTKKSGKPAGEAPPPRRHRPKKPPASSNPHEFYYYSGFGPRWGKKRGETSKMNNSCSMPKNFEEEHEIEGKSEEFDNTEYEEEEEDEEEEMRENGKKRVRKPIKARSLKSLM